jgi:hypothetical protein
VNTDLVWANTAESENRQNAIHKKIVSVKKDILDYILNKEAISSEEYSRLIGVGVKKLNE